MSYCRIKLLFVFFSLSFSTMAWSAGDEGKSSEGGCSNCTVADAVKMVNATLISGLGTTPDDKKNVNPWLAQLFTAIAGAGTGVTFDAVVAVVAAINTVQSNNWIAQDAQTQTQQNIEYLLGSSVSSQAKNSASYASCVPIPGATGTSNCSTPGTKQTKTNQIFSAGSLLSKMSMDKKSDDFNSAVQFIQFLSDQGNQLLNLPDNLSKAKSGANPKVDNFRASIGTYQAAQSVGLSVLFDMLAERTKQQGLGKTAGMPNQDASPLEVEAYSVQMPMDPEWIQNNVVKASMLDVQKQQLLLMVGIQNELFKIRMQLEKLTATSAATQLQLLNDVNRTSLDDLRTKAIQAQ